VSFRGGAIQVDVWEIDGSNGGALLAIMKLIEVRSYKFTCNLI
jgi:hypothetical protein